MNIINVWLLLKPLTNTRNSQKTQALWTTVRASYVSQCIHHHFSSPYCVNLLMHTGYLVVWSSWVWKDTLSKDNCTYSRIQAGTLIILLSSDCYLQWCMAVHAGSAHQWSRGDQQVSRRVWEEPEVCCMALNFLWGNSRHVQCGEVGILLHDLHRDQVSFLSVR